MSRHLLKTLLASATIGFFALSSASAFAATTRNDCDGTGGSTNLLSKIQSGGATAATDCEYLSPPDTSYVANVTNINTAQFFGINAWESAGVNQQDANASSGSWSIPSYDSSYLYMIVFKDGAGTNLVGFLIANGKSSGTWDTPFTDPPFSLSGNSTSKQVSHFSIFRYKEGVTVAEPGTLGLLGLGLLGIAIMRRRRSV
jgi:hypothetical protein